MGFSYNEDSNKSSDQGYKSEIREIFIAIDDNDKVSVSSLLVAEESSEGSFFSDDDPRSLYESRELINFLRALEKIKPDNEKVIQSIISSNVEKGKFGLLLDGFKEIITSNIKENPNQLHIFPILIGKDTAHWLVLIIDDKKKIATIFDSRVHPMGVEPSEEQIKLLSDLEKSVTLSHQIKLAKQIEELAKGRRDIKNIPIIEEKKLAEEAELIFRSVKEIGGYKIIINNNNYQISDPSLTECGPLICEFVKIYFFYRNSLENISEDLDHQILSYFERSKILSIYEDNFDIFRKKHNISEEVFSTLIPYIFDLAKQIIRKEQRELVQNPQSWKKDNNFLEEDPEIKAKTEDPKAADKTLLEKKTIEEDEKDKNQVIPVTEVAETSLDDISKEIYGGNNRDINSDDSILEDNSQKERIDIKSDRKAYERKLQKKSREENSKKKSGKIAKFCRKLIDLIAYFFTSLLDLTSNLLRKKSQKNESKESPINDDIDLHLNTQTSRKKSGNKASIKGRI